jgi:hypothetical protein
MKKIIFPLIIICLFSFKMQSSNHFLKTKYPPLIFDSTDVILGLAEYTELNYTSILAAIKTMPGVNYTAYCENHQVFLFYIDKTIYASKELFYNDFIKQYDFQSITALKEGSIKDIINFCSFVNSADAAAYKLTQ